MKNNISIIIPNYNGEKLLKECLESILKQNYKEFEIIVVDDYSTDNSLEVLKKYPVKVIQNKENLGFAGTVNAGIKEASNEYLLLLNNDVVLDPNFLGAILEGIIGSPDVFSVSSKMLRYKEPEYIDDTGDQYTLFGWAYKRGDGDKASEFTKRSEVFSTCAGAGLYRKSVLNKIGLFDTLHFAYLEDIDLGWRARINGYRNIYEPNAVCYHIGSATFASGQKYSDQKVFLSARNNIYIIYKNMPLGQFILNSPFLLAGFTIKLAFFSYKGYFNSYFKGISEGIRTCKNLKKVEYEKKNLINYIKIEKEIAKLTFKYTKKKITQFILKKLSKAIETKKAIAK